MSFAANIFPLVTNIFTVHCFRRLRAGDLARPVRVQPLPHGRGRGQGGVEPGHRQRHRGGRRQVPGICNFRNLIYNHGVTTRKSLDFCLHIKFNLMVEMILI